jgi:hypothetical protein
MQTERMRSSRYGHSEKVPAATTPILCSDKKEIKHTIATPVGGNFLRSCRHGLHWQRKTAPNHQSGSRAIGVFLYLIFFNL